MTCESCGSRPARRLLAFKASSEAPAERFAVCDDCSPLLTLVTMEGAL